MIDHLRALESAISDVGVWTWWTANVPGAFQVEFSGTQLWNPPSGEGKPSSSQIALRFRKPRLVYFLSLSSAVPEDWPDRLQRDQLKPFGVDHDAFTLTNAELCCQLVAKATSVRALVGQLCSSLPTAGEAFLGFEAGPVGLIVAAESLGGAFNYHSELDAQAVVEAHRQWWEYWREYWRRRETDDPLPKDYACEVTIPLASED